MNVVVTYLMVMVVNAVMCGASPENSLDDRYGKTKTSNNTETNDD